MRYAVRRPPNDRYNRDIVMNRKLLVLTFCVACACLGQRKEVERPARQAARGTHGAVAAGTEFATQAGMRMYYHGGNAVDVGIAPRFAACVTEFSHFGMGGESPILIRTKSG